MYSNEELFNGIKDGKIGLDDLKQWSNEVFAKVKTDYEHRKGENDSQIRELQAQLDTLNATYKALGETSQKEKSDLNNVIENLNKKLADIQNGELNTLTQQRDKYKSDLEKLNAEMRQAKLLNVAKTLTSRLKLKNADYAAHDLVRDGIITLTDDGKYRLNFKYFDEGTKSDLVSTKTGTDDNLTELVEDMKILMSGKNTSYNRLGELYPITEEVKGGSGSSGDGVPQGKDQSLLEIYQGLFQN